METLVTANAQGNKTQMTGE